MWPGDGPGSQQGGSPRGGGPPDRSGGRGGTKAEERIPTQRPQDWVSTGVPVRGGMGGVEGLKPQQQKPISQGEKSPEVVCEGLSPGTVVWADSEASRPP